jgi:hypothetical protein
MHHCIYEYYAQLGMAYVYILYLHTNVHGRMNYKDIEPYVSVFL